MNNYFEQEFDLRYYEMDNVAHATPVTILTLLQETAADHCLSAGHSLFDLVDNNLGWVLLSGMMQMERYPSYKEKITIRTWISKYHSIRGIRENLIYDEEGTIIGRAKGLWLFYDIERRRPTKILSDFKETWSWDETQSISCDIMKKLESIECAADAKEFKVNMYDTDTNKHVNNIRYLQWVMESVPEEILENYYLHTIDGRFISEAQYGDTIVSSIKQGIEENSFLHAIHLKGTDKLCALAETIWRKKKNDLFCQ